MKPFADQLRRWTPAEIAFRLNCPASTVYSWRSSHAAARIPPAWLQALVLAKLRSPCSGTEMAAENINEAGTK